MIAVRSAVAPVAHAFETLYTGMPVWPICFCSAWPIAAAWPIRLPAASTPMSFIVTPPSVERGLRGLGGEVDGVLVGVLPELRHVDAEDPDVVAGHGYASRGLEAEADGLGAVIIRAHRVGRQAHLHPERHVLGIGRRVDHVAAHAGAPAVDDRRHERHRDARRGQRHDGEGPHLALGRDVDRLELGAEARRARVAPVEELRPARRALVGDQVRLVAEHQVIDEGNLS